MLIKSEDMQLISTITDLKEIPSGALNIRIDGKAVIRSSSPHIHVGPNDDGNGLKVEIDPGTKNETVHVPVIVTQAGFKDKVYNTFIVGEDADITIIAGCGIHNDSHADSGHDGIHTIIVKKGAHMKYVEKHYGEGTGLGKRILNPTTDITIEDGASAEMEMVQIKGVDDTIRETVAHIGQGGNLKIIERLMTHDVQRASSQIEVFLDGKGSNAQVLSRSVARDSSFQLFKANLVGREEVWDM